MLEIKFWKKKKQNDKQTNKQINKYINKWARYTSKYCLHMHTIALPMKLLPFSLKHLNENKELVGRNVKIESKFLKTNDLSYLYFRQVKHIHINMC